MMNKSLHFVSTFVLLWFILSGCQPDHTDSEISEIIPITISKPEIFLDSEQGDVYLPGQIELLNNEYIAVLDYPTNQVLLFDHEGNLNYTFGGEGRGPGETLSARFLQQTENHMYVIDPDLLRINQFSKSGEFIKSFSFETGIHERVITVADETVYYHAAMGTNGKLIRIVNADTGHVQFFGDAMGDEYQPGDMEEERRKLQMGEIPELFKNRITAYYSESHLYVFLNSYSRLQKYTVDGNLIWETEINHPLNKSIFDRAVERAREPGAPGTVPSWRYITSMKVINGDTYLLWAPFEDSDRQMIKINDYGTIESIYHIPEEEPMFFDFTIDIQSNILYLTAPEKGEVYRAMMPG
jgi:hypothetical protein